MFYFFACQLGFCQWFWFIILSALASVSGLIVHWESKTGQVALFSLFLGKSFPLICKMVGIFTLDYNLWQKSPVKKFTVVWHDKGTFSVHRRNFTNWKGERPRTSSTWLKKAQIIYYFGQTSAKNLQQKKTFNNGALINWPSLTLSCHQKSMHPYKKLHLFLMMPIKRGLAINNWKLFMHSSRWRRLIFCSLMF